MIESDRTYVMDRRYAKFELFNRIVDVGSSYVCRIRDNSVFTALEEKPLSDTDRAARVLSDQIISLGSGSSKEKRNHPVRLVVIVRIRWLTPPALVLSALRASDRR